MADTRGTWSLSEAWAEKGNAEWVPIPNVWVTPSLPKVNTGYIGCLLYTSDAADE